MSTLTGLYISQSYGGVIHLSTNTGIVANTPTLLEDGNGNSLGLFIRSNGSISGSSFTGSLAGTASVANNAISSSFATSAANATTASHAINAVSASYSNYAQTASFALNVPTSTATASYLSGSSAIVQNDIIITGQVAAHNTNPIRIGRGATNNNDDNLAFGYQALANNTGSSGGGNTAFGYQALSASFTINNNMAIGYQALSRLTGNENNLVIGNRALRVANTPSANTIIGMNAATDVTSGSFNNNTAVGEEAMNRMRQGISNVAIGFRAMYNNDNTLGSGSNNVIVGSQAAYLQNPGDANVVIGSLAAESINSNNNIYIGYAVGGTNLKTGEHNTIIGKGTGAGITTGHSNTILGAQVTGLGSGLSNNIILADGSGSIRAQYSGSWKLSGGQVSASSFLATSFTGSLIGTASFATTASFALNASNVVSLTANNNYTGNQIYSGSVSFRVINVAIASSTASISLNSGSYFTIDLAGGNTHITAVSASRGQSAVLQLTQPFAGNGTVTFNSMFSFPTGSAFSTSLSQSAVDIVSFVSFDGTKLRSIGANNYIPV